MAKDSPKVIELKTRIEELESINKTLNDTLYALDQEKKQMLQASGTIRQSDYDSLLKQLEREKQATEQYKRLYENEKNKRIELKKSFNPDNEKLIKELQSNLSRKGTGGKPRNNGTKDADVLHLRNEGKTIRNIVALTGLSTATITKILKNVRADNH
jgi:predicted RNase H-like nuclease (RuvC/YqgF family)